VQNSEQAKGAHVTREDAHGNGCMASTSGEHVGGGCSGDMVMTFRRGSEEFQYVCLARDGGGAKHGAGTDALDPACKLAPYVSQKDCSSAQIQPPPDRVQQSDQGMRWNEDGKFGERSRDWRDDGEMAKRLQDDLEMSRKQSARGHGDGAWVLQSCQGASGSALAGSTTCDGGFSAASCSPAHVLAACEWLSLAGLRKGDQQDAALILARDIAWKLFNASQLRGCMHAGICSLCATASISYAECQTDAALEQDSDDVDKEQAALKRRIQDMHATLGAIQEDKRKHKSELLALMSQLSDARNLLDSCFEDLCGKDCGWAVLMHPRRQAAGRSFSKPSGVSRYLGDNRTSTSNISCHQQQTSTDCQESQSHPWAASMLEVAESEACMDAERGDACGRRQNDGTDSQEDSGGTGGVTRDMAHLREDSVCVSSTKHRHGDGVPSIHLSINAQHAEIPAREDGKGADTSLLNADDAYQYQGVRALDDDGTLKSNEQKAPAAGGETHMQARVHEWVLKVHHQADAAAKGLVSKRRNSINRPGNDEDSGHDASWHVSSGTRIPLHMHPVLLQVPENYEQAARPSLPFERRESSQPSVPSVQRSADGGCEVEEVCECAECPEEADMHGQAHGHSMLVDASSILKTTKVRTFAGCLCLPACWLV
jgi:hypothetical protein